MLRGHDKHVVEVLGTGANEGDAADVDFLDDFGGIVGVGHGILKRIEVNDDEVEGGDVVFLHFVLVGGQATASEDTAKHFGVQGLHATAQNGGVAGERLHRFHGRVERLDEIKSASRGVNLHSILLQQVHNSIKACFVKY